MPAFCLKYNCISWDQGGLTRAPSRSSHVYQAGFRLSDGRLVGYPGLRQASRITICRRVVIIAEQEVNKLVRCKWPRNRNATLTYTSNRKVSRRMNHIPLRMPVKVKAERGRGPSAGDRVYIDVALHKILSGEMEVAQPGVGQISEPMANQLLMPELIVQLHQRLIQHPDAVHSAPGGFKIDPCIRRVTGCGLHVLYAPEHDCYRSTVRFAFRGPLILHQTLIVHKPNRALDL